MAITFMRLDATGEDHDALVEFMTRNKFPFHGRPRPIAEDVEAAISKGAYRDEDNDSFWIDHSKLGRIGFFRLEDLSDDAPLFDLRLDTRSEAAAWGSRFSARLPTTCSAPCRTSTALRDRPARTTPRCARPSCAVAGSRSTLPRRLARGRRRTGCRGGLQHHPA